MNSSLGLEMHDLAKRLFPINRSLTGPGVRQSLAIIQEHLADLQIHEVNSGTQAFDWEIPNEWAVNDAFVKDENGVRVIDFNASNLHLMGYSTPIDKKISREELLNHLHALPDQPSAIPYVTSYYSKDWGFCIAASEIENIGSGPFHVYIDSTLSPGVMNFAELIIPGQCEEEILLSTYICHPSMANNELSGPVVLTFLAKWLKGLPNRKYTYRLILVPETVGAIYYISKHLQDLKKSVRAGWVLTCLGDERSFSYLPSRNGNTLADKVSKKVLSEIFPEYKTYSWLSRGSDERQYCAPGVDLPIASIMRTKYGEYPEYHTSLDDLSLVTPNGLFGGYTAIKEAITMLENNQIFKSKVLCEPQLGKRGLYPNTGIKNPGNSARNLINVLSYLDGELDIIDVATKCELSFMATLEIVQTLFLADLLEKIG